MKSGPLAHLRRRPCRSRCFQWFIGLALLLAVIAGRALLAQQARNSAAAPITASAIVEQMVMRNDQRAEQIGLYTSRRHYHLAYRGFPHSAEADLVVDATCNGVSSKSFRIVSEAGSHLLIDRVLRKLLRTEQEAAGDRSSNALTPANYKFTLVNSEIDEGRPTYVLRVEPKESRTLLYRGTIWVDAQDYAVVRIEAEPARSPSFWIRNTKIHHVYAKAGDFWLPEQNRSETKVRFGGTAVLTIDYGTYHFARPSATNDVFAASEDSALPKTF